MMGQTSDKVAARGGSGWLGVAVDYAPLIVFIAVYKWFSPEKSTGAGELVAIIYGTAAFMVAAVIALLFSKFHLGRITPMLWLSTALVLAFGTLTILLGDPVFVQLKPTILYALFGLALLIGYWRGHALLRYLLEAAFEGLNQRGWLKLSRNWGLFFLGLAALNEGLRHLLSFESWLWAKLWVFLPLTFLFTFTQIPMLLRHGFAPDEAKDAKPES